MDIMTCPQCRRKAERPMFFPRSQQQVFDFIWNNPWCTIHEIEEALYGLVGISNTVQVHISKIRKHLVGTPFTIVTRHAPPTHRKGQPYQYRIEEVNANV